MQLDAWKFLTNNWDRADKERARLDQASSMFFETISRNDWVNVSKLLQNGCSANMLLGHKSALMVAAEYGALECVKLLMSMGAALGAQDEIGRDALFYSAEGRQDAVLHYLLHQNPRLKRLFHDNASLLIHATKSSNLFAVTALVKYDKNMINQYDRMGRTALWHVLSKTDPTDDDNEIARILMDAGADPDFTDMEGVSARNAAHTQSSRSLLERNDLNSAMEIEMDSTPDPQGPAPSSPKRGPRL